MRVDGPDPGHDAGMRTLLLAGVLAAALAPLSTAASVRSHVRLMSFSPLVVRGSGFHAREQVVVTVRSGTSAFVDRVTSTAVGVFTARFTRSLSPVNCGGLVVTAVGVRGDRAAWKAPPAVCGAQPGP